MVASLMVPIVMALLTVSVMNVALPVIRKEYELAVDQAAWVITVYYLFAAVMMPVSARLGDIVGKRRVCLLEVLIFVAGSLICATSINYGMIITGRVLQGIGYGGIPPLSMALIGELIPATRRGASLGVWESAASGSLVIGSPLSGFLIEHIGWRATFLTFALVGIVALYALHRCVPRLRSGGGFRNVDWPGMTVLAAVTFSILVLLSEASSWGWSSPKTLALLTLTVISLPLFVVIETRATSPYVDLRICKQRAFAVSSLCVNLRTVVLSGTLFLTPLFATEAWGFGPTAIGMLLLCSTSMVFVGVLFGGLWADKARAWIPALSGLTLMTVSGFVLGNANLARPNWYLPVALGVGGLGGGLASPALAKTATNSVSVQSLGMATGLYSMVRFSGVAFSSAILGGFLQRRLGQPHIDTVTAYQQTFGILVLGALLGVASCFFIEGKSVRPDS
jgi:DHA2 family multidrug resistance protein